MTPSTSITFWVVNPCAVVALALTFVQEFRYACLAWSVAFTFQAISIILCDREDLLK